MNNNATNHTQYFNFPLFTGTDKPSVLTDWNGTMEELDSTLEDYRVRISGCEQTTQSFMDRLVVLKNQFNELVARVQGDENIIENQGLEIDGLQNALLEANESIKRILTDMGTLRTDIETMETLVNNCVTTVGTLTSQVNTLASNVQSLNADFQSMDATIGHMDESIATINGRVNTLNGRVDTLNGSVSSLDNRVDATESDIDALQGGANKQKALEKYSILYSPSTVTESNDIYDDSKRFSFDYDSNNEPYWYFTGTVLKDGQINPKRDLNGLLSRIGVRAIHTVLEKKENGGGSLIDPILGWGLGTSVPITLTYQFIDPNKDVVMQWVRDVDFSATISDMVRKSETVTDITFEFNNPIGQTTRRTQDWPQCANFDEKGFDYEYATGKITDYRCIITVKNTSYTGGLNICNYLNSNYDPTNLVYIKEQYDLYPTIFFREV